MFEILLFFCWTLFDVVSCLLDAVGNANPTKIGVLDKILSISNTLIHLFSLTLSRRV